jgi:hypothetical protein
MPNHKNKDCKCKQKMYEYAGIKYKYTQGPGKDKNDATDEENVRHSYTSMNAKKLISYLHIYKYTMRLLAGIYIIFANIYTIHIFLNRLLAYVR